MKTIEDVLSSLEAKGFELVKILLEDDEEAEMKVGVAKEASEDIGLEVEAYEAERQKAGTRKCLR